MELPVPRRGEPGGGRDPRSIGIAAASRHRGIGERAMTRLTVPVSKRDHMQGDPKAPLTLVEYGDYECPHCGRAYPIIKRVQSRLGNRLCFVFRNFPLAEVHPHAEAAAEAAESVGAHGGEKAFWAMHDLIFEHQASLTDPALARLAVEAGVDADDVLTDLSS